MTWHVDDLKISHLLESVVTDVLGDLDGVFGREAPMTVPEEKFTNISG